MKQVLVEAAWRDRSLLAINQAGLVNNLNDGLAWGLLPILFAGARASPRSGSSPPSTRRCGPPASSSPAPRDRTGRKPLIVAGMLIQATALAGFATVTGAAGRATAAVALGVGTAFVYPTCSLPSGMSPTPWRASAVGVYRLWRDGYAIGALIAGITADLVGLRGAVLIVAVLTAASGLLRARFVNPTTGTTVARTKVHHPLFARFYAWVSPRMAGFGERRDQLLAGLTARCSRWVPATA